MHHHTEVSLPQQYLTSHFNRSQLKHQDRPSPQSTNYRRPKYHNDNQSFRHKDKHRQRMHQIRIEELSVEFSPVPRTVRTVQRNGTIIIISSRSHRGRNSLIFTTSGTAPTGINFVVHRADNIVYISVQNRSLSHLRLPPVAVIGRSHGNATCTIDISTHRNVAAKVSTTSHTHAVGALISSTARP